MLSRLLLIWQHKATAQGDPDVPECLKVWERWDHFMLSWKSVISYLSHFLSSHHALGPAFQVCEFSALGSVWCWEEQRLSLLCCGILHQSPGNETCSQELGGRRLNCSKAGCKKGWRVSYLSRFLLGPSRMVLRLFLSAITWMWKSLIGVRWFRALMNSLSQGTGLNHPFSIWMIVPIFH